MNESATSVVGLSFLLFVSISPFAYRDMTDKSCTLCLLQMAGEMLLFACTTVLKRTEPGQRQSVDLEGDQHTAHCHVRSDGLSGIVVTDREYPMRVAFSMLSLLLDDFVAVHGDSWKHMTKAESMQFPEAQAYLQKSQDPAAVDNVFKIQKDLDEITSIMHTNIESILERGVKLDDLLQRSENLSAQAKMFCRQARRTNSCCVIS